MQINTTSDALDNLNKKLGGADIEIEPSTNKVDALKKIYKTLGGTDDVKGLSTVYQVLEKITEVAEGGGGGDFSTAEVTINNESGFNYNIPYLSEDGGIEFISGYGSTSGTFNVVLYKGNAVLVFVEEVSVVYTGNVTELEAGLAYLITGDATITVTSI